MWQPILHDARQGHRPLVVFAAACVVASFAVLLAGLVDDRTITGAPAWNKPFKFFTSSAIYAATVAWYLRQLRSRGRPSRRADRLVWLIGTGVWVTLTIELVLIVTQAWRGVASHFNVDTPFDAVVFATMGVLIAALSVLHAVLWGWLLTARWHDRVWLSACRWGAGLTLAGLLTGALMLGASEEQKAILRAGGRAAAGAHTVGAPDGGPGLPLLNWSTQAGDRRVAHFLGLHAMQALPLVMLLLPAWWPARHARAVVRVTGLAYGALIALAVEQARQGQPLLGPGAALAVLAAITLVAWAGALVVLRARASASRARQTPVDAPRAPIAPV